MPDSGTLFAAWQPRLVAYFRRAIGDRETARDLAQEVFLRASRARLPGTDGEQRAWLFRVARNLALDHHRHCRRHPESPELPVESVRPASQDVDLAVTQALALLPDLDRDVFLMREVGGTSPAPSDDAKFVFPENPFAGRRFAIRIRAKRLR